MNEYIAFFKEIKQKFPDTYDLRIKEYLCELQHLYESKNKVFMIAVLNELRDNYSLKSIFPEIYEKYIETRFFTRDLTTEDIDYIVISYVNIIKEKSKEVSYV